MHAYARQRSELPTAMPRLWIHAYRMALILIVALAIALSTGPRVALAEGCGVDYVTQGDIVDYAERHGIDLDALSSKSPTYAQQPNTTTSPYNPGQLSQSTLNDALKVLNFVRYVAGVPDNVSLYSKYNESAQAASLVMCLNGTISHNPSRPSGISDDLYELGSDGAGKSNIGMGHRNPVHSILSYLQDEDDSNIDTVGHRRWVLNPKMGKVGFGFVKGKGWTFTAMYAMDRSGSSSCTNVAWPAQNMPMELFHKNDPWSLSVGKQITGNVSVTLTRKSDGKVWHMGSKGGDGYFTINNGGYGLTDAIIFRPNNFSFAEGTSFSVHIEGGNLSPIDYNVNFFSLDNGESQQPSVNPATISGPTSFTKTFGDADFSLGQSISTGQTLRYSSSDTNVIGAVTGTMKVKGAGTAVITVTAEENDWYPEITKTVTVTVNKAKATVKADNKTMRSGEQRPKLTATVTGSIAQDPGY